MVTKMKWVVLLVTAFMMNVAVTGKVFAAEYKVDKGHTTIGFSAGHLMVSKVPGQFDDYDGTVVFDAASLETSKITFSIKVASINTRNADRDKHLKSPDFFDAEKFPTIDFTSKSIVKSGSGYNVTGDLTMHGVTKEVTFPINVAGPVNNPFGGTAIGIDASFKVNRQDYGVSWNKTLDNGGMVVSDEIDVNVSVEAHQS